MPLFSIDSWYEGGRVLSTLVRAESLAAMVRAVEARWPSELESSCIRVSESEGTYYGSKQGELTTRYGERFVVRRVRLPCLGCPYIGGHQHLPLLGSPPPMSLERGDDASTRP